MSLSGRINLATFVYEVLEEHRIAVILSFMAWWQPRALDWYDTCCYLEWRHQLQISRWLPEAWPYE